MASLSLFRSVLYLATAALLCRHVAAGTNTFGLEFHHRFSDKVLSWAEQHGLTAAWNPEDSPRGSPEYYAALVRHDLLRHRHHGRSLAAGDLYAFADGNETVLFTSLGYLHYALVELGTPNVTFLVALDTGSDLFWLPCNCKQCASYTSSNSEIFNFSTYSPENSSTSKRISCSSSMCDARGVQNGCLRPGNDCPYFIQYASENTSSAGFLVQDILYLAKEYANYEISPVPIIFGCGQIQTGMFLDGGAPNGLFGLGMDNLSVPSVLSKTGLVSDSFSMCFSPDGLGRLNFGDKGSSDQYETPLNLDNQHTFYNITVTGMIIGNNKSNTEFAALVDSGTSFSILADPMYAQLTHSFTDQVKEKRMMSPDLPFEYCYEMSSGQSNITIPDVNLTTKGGSTFPVTQPLVFLVNKTGQVVGYCLAVLQSTSVNIIGQNFLTGLRIVFDREKLVLAWKEFDCYNALDTSSLNVHNNSRAPAPDAYAPSSIDPVAIIVPSQNGWAPHASPSTLLNTLINLFLLGSLLI